jgi:type II secretory pathway component PulF
MTVKSFVCLALGVFMKRSSVGSKTAILLIVLTYELLSHTWQSTASDVDRLINAKPTVGDTPRDSLTAQTSSWDAMLVAAVTGLVDGASLVAARRDGV